MIIKIKKQNKKTKTKIIKKELHDDKKYLK